MPDPDDEEAAESDPAEAPAAALSFESPLAPDAPPLERESVL